MLFIDFLTLSMLWIVFSKKIRNERQVLGRNGRNKTIPMLTDFMYFQSSHFKNWTKIILLQIIQDDQVHWVLSITKLRLNTYYLRILSITKLSKNMSKRIEIGVHLNLIWIPRLLSCHYRTIPWITEPLFPLPVI